MHIVIHTYRPGLRSCQIVSLFCSVVMAGRGWRPCWTLSRNEQSHEGLGGKGVIIRWNLSWTAICQWCVIFSVERMYFVDNEWMGGQYICAHICAHYSA